MKIILASIISLITYLFGALIYKGIVIINNTPRGDSYIQKSLEIKESLDISKNKKDEFHKEQHLEKWGFVINSTYRGYHTLLLQIEKNDSWLNLPFKDSVLTIRYRIIPDTHLPCYEDLTNVSIVFLNEKQFEIYRFFVGDLKENRSASGKFEISKRLYEDILLVKAITDQDRGDPIFWMGLSAAPNH